ncbi:hypothetical protein [Wenyingzhuangia sp. IMCC45467]
MIKKRFLILLYITCCFVSTTAFSQREVPLEEETENNENLEQEVIEENVEVYSIFNDFRIPVRENINTSDLRYNGWVTDQGMYTFRCRNGKRIRLTFWYLDRGAKEVLDSEFINITPAIDKCQKGDIEYRKQNYRQSK